MINRYMRYLALFTTTALLSSMTIDRAFAAEADADADAAAPASDTLVQEVVVSARRREERLQDVPAAVTSLSAETLAARGISDTRNLQQVTPGLRFATTGFFGQPIVRGVGNQTANQGDEANISLYVDGVYIPSLFANMFKLNNIERVEVLRGPQGTLFGRNATGGAISITTKAPSEEFHGNAMLGYGRFNAWEQGLYVTGKVATGIATDLAIYNTEDSGYINDLANQGFEFGRTKEFSARTRTDGNFESWRFSFIAGLTKSNNNAPVSQQPLNGQSIALFPRPDGSRPVYTTKPWNTSEIIEPYVKVYSYYGSFKASVDFGNLTLTSTTSGANNKGLAFTDTTAIRVPLNGAQSISNAKNEVYSQEFQLAPLQAERLQWVLGAYYLNSNGGNQPLMNTQSLAITYSKLDTHAYAAFGEGTYELTDQLSVTAGLRYSYESKLGFGYARSGAGVTTRVLAATTNHWDAWTPRLIVRYIVPDTVNIYGSFSQGFKSGQINVANLTGVPVQPEELTAYEVGAKTLSSDRFRASIAAYYYDYKNQQVSVRQSTTALGGITQNAANSTIYGGEFNLDARLAEDWTASFNTAYTHARYDSFPNALVTVLLPAPTATFIGTQTPVDASGKRIPRTPQWTVNAALQYRHVFEFGTIAASGNLYWLGKQYWDPTNAPRLAEEAHTLVNGEISWSPPRARYRFSLWGTNLLNEAVATTISSATVAERIAYDRPRSYGVRARVDF